jgi:hypothetical protein
MKQVDYSGFMATMSRSVLITGLYNVGKTYLLGAALAHHTRNGEKGVFVHVGEEPSFASLGAHNLENVTLYSIETYKDFEVLERDLIKGAFTVGALDSLEALVELAAADITGGDRVIGEGKGEYGKTEWSLLKFRVFRALARLQKSCQWVLASCPLTIRENQITGEKLVTPALPGQQAYGILGRFSYAGVLRAKVVDATTIQRRITFAPSGRYQTRCNSIRPIVQDITVPSGTGAWAPIQNALDKSMELIHAE